jgi:hypothetical protein
MSNGVKYRKTDKISNNLGIIIFDSLFWIPDGYFYNHPALTEISDLSFDSFAITQLMNKPTTAKKAAASNLAEKLQRPVTQ